MKKLPYNEDKINYSIMVKIGIIISLCLCIFLVMFFPKSAEGNKEIPYFPEPVITLLDIPQTNMQSHSSPPAPPTPIITSLLKPVDDLESLPDVVIKDNSEIKDGISTGKINSTLGTGVYEASSFPFVPRQLLEVVPQKVEGVEGYIKVKILVGIDGRIKQHKVLENTTESKTALKYVIDAVYKSRWQSITIENQKVEYWIEKTYTFN